MGLAEGGITPQERAAGAEAALHRTEYPERDLSIVDILPAGVQQGVGAAADGGDAWMKAEEIVAIGDNWNDVSMLEVAGVRC